MPSETSENRNLEILKSLLPYFPTSSKRTILTCLKMIEVQRVLTQFDEEQEKTLSACSAENCSLEHMLQILKGFCNEKEQEMLDTWLNMMQALQLFREYRKNAGNTPQSTPMDFLQSMLSPEQKNLLDTYQTLFTP
ncbi:MAG: hypothetical protein ACI4C1_10890 [Lachnospiraceae bacterium]